MPKVGMQPIRRAQLIEATLECVHKYGLSDTTIARISRQAGVSSGIISHYFGGKDGLLEATMHQMLIHLQQGVLMRAESASDPLAHLHAIIDGNFDFEQVAPRSVTTWLAFWTQAMHVPELARLQKINMRRLQSNLRYWLRRLLPKPQAHLAANGLAALIDGLWLRGAFEEGGIDEDYARRVCRDYLDLQLAACPQAGTKTEKP